MGNKNTHTHTQNRAPGAEPGPGRREQNHWHREQGPRRIEKSRGCSEQKPGRTEQGTGRIEQGPGCTEWTVSGKHWSLQKVGGAFERPSEESSRRSTEAPDASKTPAGRAEYLHNTYIHTHTHRLELSHGCP